MTGKDQLKRAIQACRCAGLPVVEEEGCTCRLGGRLVVLTWADGLEVVWPYELRPRVWRQRALVVRPVPRPA